MDIIERFYQAIDSWDIFSCIKWTYVNRFSSSFPIAKLNPVTFWGHQEALSWLPSVPKSLQALDSLCHELGCSQASFWTHQPLQNEENTGYLTQMLKITLGARGNFFSFGGGKLRPRPRGTKPSILVFRRYFFFQQATGARVVED